MHIFLVALSQLPLANKGFGLCALYLWPLSLAHIAQSTHRPCTFPPTQQTALNNAVSGRKGGVANEKWKLLLIKSQSYQQKKQQHEQKLLPHCSRSGSQPPTVPTHPPNHPLSQPATRHPCWLSSLQMLQRQNYACMCVRVCGASASHVG